MAEGPIFERNLGSDGSHGINFEWETTLLTYLRCVKFHQDWKKNSETGVKSFVLANNVKGVGAFDDVVVRVEYVEQGEVKTKLLLCQCKHVTGATKIDKYQNYLGPKEIQKYFDSFLKVYRIFNEEDISEYSHSSKQCDLKKHSEEIETKGKLKCFLNCGFEKCEFLFLSNIESLPSDIPSFYKVDQCFQKTDVSKQLLSVTCGNEYHLNSEWCLKNLKCDNSFNVLKDYLITEFCNMFRVFLKQDDKLYIQINSAIKICCSKDINGIDDLRGTMLEEMKSYFDSNAKSCTALTEISNLLGNIMGFLELKKSSKKVLKHYRQKLKMSSTSTIKEITENLPGSSFNIPSQFPKIERLKIFQTLIELGEKNLCIILNDEEDAKNLLIARKSRNYMQANTVYIFVEGQIKLDGEVGPNEILLQIDKINVDKTNTAQWVKEIFEETSDIIGSSIVCFQGHETTLRSICSNWKDFLDEHSGCKILESELTVIGKKLPPEPDCYIKRRFKMKVISDELLKNFYSLVTPECQEKFLLFSKVEENHNGPLYACNIFECIHDVKKYISNIRDKKKFIFCFTYFKGKLEPRYTFSIQNNIKTEISVDEEYLLNYKGDQRITILNDIAGMGKSTTMLVLALSYKGQNKSHFVYFIELNKYGSIIENEDSIGNHAEAIDFVATKLLNLKEIEYNLFINACNVTGKVALFFDAYDELSVPAQNIISAIIVNLERTNIGRIFVSSRPMHAKDLEKIILLESIEFCKLLQVEREYYLFELWKKMKNCEEENYEELRKFVNKIICSLEAEETELNELLATPLQIKMISKAYYNTMIKACKHEVDINSIEINMMNLYDKFVHSHAEHYFEVKFGGNWINWDTEKTDREIQGKLSGALDLACSIVVPHLEVQIHNMQNVIKTLHNDLGLIIHIDPPVFIHRTIAEYLAAKYIVSELFSKQSDKLTTNIIEFILMDAKFYVLRKFINSFLKGENCPEYFDNTGSNMNILLKHIPRETPLHVAASEGNKELLEALLQRDSTLINMRNNLGRTPFHNACLNGKTETANILLLKHACSVDTVDRDGNTPLHDAIANGSVEIIKLILRIDVPDVANLMLFQEDAVFSRQSKEKYQLINCQDKKGNTSMHLAVKCNNVEVVKLLLEDHFFKMNILNNKNNNVLHLSALTGSIETMQLVLEYNDTQIEMESKNTFIHRTFFKTKSTANKLLLKQKNIYEETPLHVACHHGHINAVELLINHGSSINEVGNCGDSVFHVATNMRHINLLKKLLSYESSLIQQKNNVGKTPLHIACYDGFTDAVELLLKYDCSVYDRDRFGNNALHMASHGDNVNILAKLLQHDSSSINLKNDFGRTPLQYACCCGSSDAVELLMKHNCTIDGYDNNGNTALHVAVRENRLKLIQKIIQYQPSLVNQKNTTGNTPMFYACLHGCYDALELLIKYECSVNERGKNGETLLHLAAEENHVQIVEKLLQCDASLLNVQNNNGETPLHLACSRGNTNAVEILLANHCAIDTTDRGNKTALHFASKLGRRHIVRLLVENNSSIINLKDGENKTALQYALHSEFTEIVKYLKENGAIDDIPTERCIIL